MSMRSLFIFFSFLLVSFHTPNTTAEDWTEVPAIKAKDLQKTLAKVNDSLYASRYEVSNSQYRLFLDDLLQRHALKQLAIAQIDSLQWRYSIPDGEPYMEYYHTHPVYDSYPVVNISYEGAVLFCEWLTNTYNSQPKRKFDSVVFRLPTEVEWMMAAKANRDEARYPWDGDELAHTKGRYKGMALCNYKRTYPTNLTGAGRAQNNDNADVLAPVQAYWPNEIGLYNASGNAGEMVQTKGIVKGGNWSTTSEALEITHKEVVTPFKASPKVGFRYFMVVVKK